MCDLRGYRTTHPEIFVFRHTCRTSLFAMNVLARKFKPTPTAAVSSTDNRSPPRRQRAVESPSPTSEALPTTAQPTGGFDYEAEVRRLRSQKQATSVASSGYHAIAVDGSHAWVAPRVEPSRFRWTQGATPDASPPSERPQRVVSAAAKARNTMFRPVEQTAPDLTTAPDWSDLTPSQKASRILGKF